MTRNFNKNTQNVLRSTHLHVLEMSPICPRNFPNRKRPPTEAEGLLYGRYSTLTTLHVFARDIAVPIGELQPPTDAALDADPFTLRN